MRLFKKYKQTAAPEPVVAQTEIHSMDFEGTMEEILRLSPKAQATFSFRLVDKLPLKVVKSLHFYASRRLGYAKAGDTGQSYRPGSGGTVPGKVRAR